MYAYALTSAVIFGILFCIWKKSDWLNVFLKTIFFGMMVWGIVQIIK